MKKIISTDDAPRAIGPYAQAIRANNTVYVSGQIALDAKTGEFLAGPTEDQARKALENLRAVLTAAGASVSDVVKTTIFLTDMAEFAKVNEVYAAFMGDHRPARATVEVAGLPKGATFEIDAIAVVDDNQP